MAFPSLLVEVAWASAPLAASPTYIDVTDYVVSVDTKRGRQYETDVIEAGTATIVFDNSDARFTPERATLADGSANPYYPNVDKNKIVRISVVWNAVTYRLFTGFIESFATKGGSSYYGEQTVTCVDIFKFLGFAPVTPAYQGEVQADSPIAYWPLQDAADTTTGATSLVTSVPPLLSTVGGHGAGNAIVYGGATSLLDGMTCAALSSPDAATSVANARMTVLQSSVNPAPNGSFTLELWFNAGVTAPVGSQPVVIAGCGQAGTATPYYQLLLPVSTSPVGELRWVVGYTTSAGNLSSVSAQTSVGVTDGGWHHAVCRYDVPNNQASLILDGGTPIVTTALTTPVTNPNSGTPFQVGGIAKEPATGKDYGAFTGQVAQVAMYNGVLSTARAQTHYSRATAGYAGETEVARINRLLGYANNMAAQSGDSALSALSPGLSATSDVLAGIQQTASTAGGVTFIRGDGTLAYQNRNHRAGSTSVAAFADSAGTSVDADPTFTFDDTHVVDEMQVTQTGGVSQTVSVAAQPLHPTSASLDLQSSTDALYAAQWFTSVYQAAHTRCDQVGISPTAQANGALWSLILPREIGDRITIGDLPAYAPATSMDFFIEQVGYNITPNGANPEWKASFQLSPTAYADQIFILDSATRGKLDNGSRLYY